MPLGEEISFERVTAINSLAWERLQIGRDLLLVITSTADELSGGTGIDDEVERPWIPKIVAVRQSQTVQY